MITKGPRVDFLTSTVLQEELELWYQQWPLVPIRLLGEWKWIWVSLSWFLNFPYWLRFWILFGSGAGYLSPPSRKDMGGDKTSRAYTHLVSTLSGTQLKDTEKFLPRQKILDRGLAERHQGNYPPSGKVLGRGAWLGEKNWRIPRVQLKDSKVTPL